MRVNVQLFCHIRSIPPLMDEYRKGTKSCDRDSFFINEEELHHQPQMAMIKFIVVGIE